MTYFNDLAQCDYFGAEHASSLRAIGWLTKAKPFQTGEIKADAFGKLKELLKDPWQPVVSCGVHVCELCQYDQPPGASNLFVPNSSFIFVCPELVAHYVAAHHYRPPDAFITALMVCPNTRTMEYKKLLLQSGGRSLTNKSAQ